MRRGLKYASQSSALVDCGDRSEDSPMRRGLKSSFFESSLRARYSIRRFPDEEGTEMLGIDLQVYAEPAQRSEDSPMRRGLKFGRLDEALLDPNRRSEDSPMRRGLKFGRLDEALLDPNRRSEDSPMRRGLKLIGAPSNVRRNPKAIRRFPDEEGTEIRLQPE